MGRQLDLLEPVEPSSGLSTPMRTALLPMLARLLLEAAEVETPAVENLVGKEADDESDRT